MMLGRRGYGDQGYKEPGNPTSAREVEIIGRSYSTGYGKDVFLPDHCEEMRYIGC